MKAHHLLAVAPLCGLTIADDQPPKVSVYDDDTGSYKYYGCYNETTLVAGSAGTRALAGGDSLVKPDEMTVPACLKFCQGGDTSYRYAGLEWSRECWCSQSIAGIAEKLDEKDCNFPCSGNKSQACGGQLKLTVYRMSAATGGAVVSGAAVAAALMSAAFAMLS